MICYIIGAGDAPNELPKKEAEDLLIAADGGYLAARAAALVPDLLIGDLDSLGDAPLGIELVRLPVEKDMTDTAEAISEGERRGYRTFVLYGCTGGRPDHTYANLQLIAGAALRGLRVFLVGDGYTVFAIRNESVRFPAGCRGTVSVFCSGADARGVSESGLKYTLSDATLAASDPLGISNSFTGVEAEISVREGTLLIFVEGERAAEAVRFFESNAGK
jgi:thiamine pyrophosphokinase